MQYKLFLFFCFYDNDKLEHMSEALSYKAQDKEYVQFNSHCTSLC